MGGGGGTQRPSLIPSNALRSIEVLGLMDFHSKEMDFVMRRDLICDPRHWCGPLDRIDGQDRDGP